MTRLRILVDRELCEVNGLCVEVAPAVFEIGEDDVMRVKDSQPSAAEEKRVEEAVRRCPKGALGVERG